MKMLFRRRRALIACGAFLPLALSLTGCHSNEEVGSSKGATAVQGKGQTYGKSGAQSVNVAPGSHGPTDSGK